MKKSTVRCIDIWNVIVGMTDGQLRVMLELAKLVLVMTAEQLESFSKFANLVGVNPATATADGALVNAPEPEVVADEFVKSEPLPEYVGKSVRMTESNHRFFGINKSVKKDFATRRKTVKYGEDKRDLVLNAWDSVSQTWVFSSKTNAQEFIKAQEQYASKNPDYPVIVEIC